MNRKRTIQMLAPLVFLALDLIADGMAGLSAIWTGRFRIRSMVDHEDSREVGPESS